MLFLRCPERNGGRINARTIFYYMDFFNKYKDLFEVPNVFNL